MKTTGKVIFLGQIAPKNEGGSYRLMLFDCEENNNFEMQFPAALEASQGEVLNFTGTTAMKRGKYGPYLTSTGSFSRKNGGS